MCVSNLSSPYLGHVLQHRLVSVSRLLVVDGVVVAQGVDVKVPGGKVRFLKLESGK